MSRSIAGVVNRFVLVLLRGYQMVLSPVFAGMGSQCRFEPSCSQYMIDAVHSRGVLIGVSLGLWRVLRCNPLNGGGYDPAPPRRRSAQDSGQDVSRETI
ncbi:MAG: membrane protein insertion efficiency factor YidD [Chloroflexi bacterium]|nr:membrane protein insertion efficiency factor YidD [Chloroflexota bacterium]